MLVQFYKQMKSGGGVIISLICLALFLFATQLLLPASGGGKDKDTGFDDDNIAAFYQSSGEHPRVVEAVLHNFRVFYPFSQAQIWFYNPHPSSVILSYAHFYANSVSHHSEDNTTFLTDTTGAMAYWSHLASTARTSEWVLVLEDDICLYAQVGTQNLKYTLNAPCAALFRPGIVALLSSLQTSNKSQLCYALLGGSLIHSSALSGGIMNVSFMQKLFEAGGGFISRDEFVSALVVAGGGNIGPYSGFSETWWQWGNVILKERRWSLY